MKSFYLYIIFIYTFAAPLFGMDLYNSKPLYKKLGALIAYHETTDTTISKTYDHHLIIQTLNKPAWTSEQRFTNLATITRTHAFSHDGSRFAWSADYQTYVMDIQTKKIIANFDHRLYQSTSIAFFKNKPIFINLQKNISIDGKDVPIACNTKDICGESKQIHVCNDILTIQDSKMSVDTDECILYNLTTHAHIRKNIPGRIEAIQSDGTSVHLLYKTTEPPCKPPKQILLTFKTHPVSPLITCILSKTFHADSNFREFPQELCTKIWSILQENRWHTITNQEFVEKENTPLNYTFKTHPYGFSQVECTTQKKDETEIVRHTVVQKLDTNQNIIQTTFIPQNLSFRFGALGTGYITWGQNGMITKHILYTTPKDQL